MSNTSDMVLLRKASERGSILRMLCDDYGKGMTSIGNIASALDLLGQGVSAESLSFHLVYLEDQQYIRLVRTFEMPGYRRERLSGDAKPDDIRFAKMLPRGVQLVNGQIADDPAVKFG
jgi:hypothetical protein